MSSNIEKLMYKTKSSYKWNISSGLSAGMFHVSQLDEICSTCDSIKDVKIKNLEAENRKLTKQLSFYLKELRALEFKTALKTPAVSLQAVVDDLTSTHEGKVFWETALKEREGEWLELVKKGKMSKIKYYRLLNGIDQRMLAGKLGTAQPNISRLEKPGYNVPVLTLRKVARVFNIKMEDLLEN